MVVAAGRSSGAYAPLHHVSHCRLQRAMKVPLPPPHPLDPSSLLFLPLELNAHHILFFPFVSQPFSAQFLAPSNDDKSNPTSGMTASQLSAHRELMGDAPATTGTVSFSSIVGYWRPRRRVETVAVPGSSPSSSPHADVETGTSVQDGEGGGKRREEEGKKMMPVQVAVLISMPSPSHPHSYSRTGTSTSKSSISSGRGHERTMSGDTVDSVSFGKRAAKDGMGAMGGG